MSQAYSDPTRAEDPMTLPDVEVFYAAQGDLWHAGESLDICEAAEDNSAGWYWWACFPGCLPDGDPNGPFATEQEAIKAAQTDAYFNEQL